MGTLDRYLLRLTARGILVALSAVLVLILLVDFVEQTRTVDVRIDGVGLLDFAGLTLLKTPMLVETTLPFIVLFGVMLTMFQLNRRSELVVMRAAGMSVWRFVAPGLALAVALGVLSPLVLNPFATAMTARFHEARTEIAGGVRTSQAAPVWYREVGPGEQRLIRADATDPAARELYNVTFILFDAPADARPVFARRIDAASARHADGVWLLDGATELAPRRPAAALGQTSLPAFLDIGAFDQNANAETLSFWDLPAAAAAADEIGVSPAPFQLRWMRLLVTPVLLAAMALIACAASLRLLRLGGTLRRIVLAGLAGFGLYFFGNMLGAFALGGRMPLLLAAGAAPMAALLAALAAIAWMEDA